MEALGLRDTTLMVHDWGRPIGFGVAARNPDRFAAVVVANSFAWPVNGDLHFELFSRIWAGRSASCSRCTPTPSSTSSSRPGLAGRDGEPEVMAAYRAPFAERSDRLAAHVMACEIVKSRAYLAEVQRGLERLRHLPARILCGDRDIAFRDRERERFEEVFPRHRTVVLERRRPFRPGGLRAGLCQAIRSWAADELCRAAAENP